MKKCLLSLGIAAVCAAAFPQAVITDGTSSFGWTSASALSGTSNHTGTAGGTSNVFKAFGSSDQAYQEWWWYRANGVNTREYALSTEAAAPVVAGNHMTLSYREVEGFTSTIMYTINNVGGVTRVTGTNFILNEGNSALELDFFNYIDYDLTGSGGDFATLLSDNPAFRMRISEPGAPTIEYRALDADAYQVGAFSSVRTLLTNATVDNFTSSGLPFGPGDFTGGVQWHFTLNPGEQIALQTTRSMVPEPATMAVLGLGFAALLRRRRK